MGHNSPDKYYQGSGIRWGGKLLLGTQRAGGCGHDRPDADDRTKGRGRERMRKGGERERERGKIGREGERIDTERKGTRRTEREEQISLTVRSQIVRSLSSSNRYKCGVGH